MTRQSHIANSLNAGPISSVEFAGLCLSILKLGGSIRFKARGFSMKPSIRDGDIITVVPIPATRLRRGDIALYSGEGGALRAHRVISITGRGSNKMFKIRGDSFTGSLEDVASHQVLGLVTQTTRDGRSNNTCRALPRYRALVRLQCRQALHRVAPVASRRAWNALRKLGRIILEAE